MKMGLVIYWVSHLTPSVEKFCIYNLLGLTPDGSEGLEKVKKIEEDGVAPCSTLFIATLGPNCSEEELEQALSQYPGFNALKIRARGGMPVAFADFEEVEQATAAKDGLQGATLPSSDRRGLVIEYARSKMRKPD
ncbi:hypothetical protein Droror1_Dr00024611 [Drosera rotundifolia]